MTKEERIRKAYFLSMILLATPLVGFFWVGSAIALSDVEMKSVGLQVTEIYRAARGVIAQSQKLINNASNGDKGLSAVVAIDAAKPIIKMLPLGLYVRSGFYL